MRKGLRDVAQRLAPRTDRFLYLHLLPDHVRDALADADDLAAVTGLVAEVRRRGNGTAFQRDAFRRSGLLRDVVTAAAGAVRG